ncbi:hypothetical protein HELRODRAFT_176967 [Helobdella robusta]|uniref:Uncharacterized protein n=1 Tax=Helobdella robusta TaxID=6412 RepID=T1FB29_HELRO|nr:hypothetical protein HELRODRAFT_176967 [Helobdella robusta]ESN98491.1 hypothetical protein HELRODRAFT_176967 [Helobdella robusta]
MFQYTPGLGHQNRDTSFLRYRPVSNARLSSNSDDESSMMVLGSPNSDDESSLQNRSIRRMDWEDESTSISFSTNYRHQKYHTALPGSQYEYNFVGGLEEVFNSPFFSKPSTKNHQRHLSEGRINNMTANGTWNVFSQQHQLQQDPLVSSPLFSNMSSWSIADSPPTNKLTFQQQQRHLMNLNRLSLNDSQKLSNLNLGENENSRWSSKTNNTSLFTNNFLNDLTSAYSSPQQSTLMNSDMNANEQDLFPNNAHSFKFLNNKSRTSNSHFKSSPPSLNARNSFSIFSPTISKTMFNTDGPSVNNANTAVTESTTIHSTSDSTDCSVVVIDSKIQTEDINVFKNSNQQLQVLTEVPKNLLGPPISNSMKTIGESIKNRDVQSDEISLNSDGNEANNVKMRHLGKINNRPVAGRPVVNEDFSMYFVSNPCWLKSYIAKSAPILMMLMLLGVLVFIFIDDTSDFSQKTGLKSNKGNFLKVNLPLIEDNLRVKLYGQHIATDVIISSLSAFITNEIGANSKKKKTLSLMFLGSSGVGKSYAGSLIMDGFSNVQAKHLVIIPLHFSNLFVNNNIKDDYYYNYDIDNNDDVNNNNNDNKNNEDNDDDDDNFKKRIYSIVNNFKRDHHHHRSRGSDDYDNSDDNEVMVMIFLVEGLDDVIGDDDGYKKITMQILNTIKLLNNDNNDNSVDNDDADDKSKNVNIDDGYRYIFIFTSNEAGSTIDELTYKLIKHERKQRAEIALDMIMEDQAIKNQLKYSWFYQAFHENAVDHIVPFLPLEKSHVGMCTKHLLAQKNITLNYDDRDLIETLFNVIQTYPDDSENETAIFSLAGCRKVPTYVDLILAGFQ